MKNWIKYRDANENTCWAFKSGGYYIRVVPFLFKDHKKYSIGPSDEEILDRVDEPKVFNTVIDAFDYVESKY